MYRLIRAFKRCAVAEYFSIRISAVTIPINAEKTQRILFLWYLPGLLLVLGLPNLIALAVEEAGAKLPVSLRHDNDRFTARNLAYAMEHFSLIFAGSNRDNMALPSCLLCSERYECTVFWIAAGRQVEASAMRARSFITSMLAILQSFQMRLPR